MKLSAKVKKSLNIGFRVIVAMIAFWFIYRQVFVTGDFEQFSALLNQRLAERSFTVLLLIVVFLMPVNWGIEAFKWKLLINYIENISYANAYRSVLTGISMSLFTPNRIGEFFGRVFTLKLADPLKGVLLTIAGSLSQLIATLLFGSLSLLVFLPLYYEAIEPWSKYLYAGIVLFVLLADAILIMLFLRAPILSAGVHSLIRPGWKRIHEYVAVLQSVRRITLFKVLMLSITRYLVFSTQFFLMLIAFNVNIPYLHAFLLISMTYFIVTAIPTVALVDLGIRGSVAIYFISMYFVDKQPVATIILTATTMIWIINLAFPALLGLLFINRLTFLRKSRLNGG